MLELLENRQLLAITLTFEGLQDLEPIANYYNGGMGGNGSGPGPNYGVTFSGNALALTDADSGGSGNFGGEPSSPNTAFFLTGGGALTMNVPAGFERGFSFYYSAVNLPGSIQVYDGVGGTGNVLATLVLPVTPFNGAPDPNGVYSPLVPLTVEFAGTAKSVDFGGTANQIGFDNITLGPLIEIQDYRQQKTDFVKVATLISEAGVLNADGTPTAKFNKLDNDRFFIVIDDKSIGTPQIVVDQIEIQSIGRDGATVLDSLPKLRLNRQADGRFASQPLILVQDALDDAFGGNEGTENDVTIQAEAGGKLKIKYKDPTGTLTEKEIPVSKPADVKKIVLNVTYLTGIGFTEAGVRSMIADASRLFSPVDTFLEIKAVTGVADPGGLADLDEFPTTNPLRMTAEERQLLAINRDNAAKVVNVYFVKSLSAGSSAEAFPSGAFKDPADVPFTGSVVISGISNYKSVSHELLHILFDSGGHSTDRRRLIYTSLVPADGPLGKRILRSEGTTIVGSGFAQPKQAAGAMELASTWRPVATTSRAGAAAPLFAAAASRRTVGMGAIPPGFWETWPAEAGVRRKPAFAPRRIATLA
ncbi:hypothetical protein [Paludisphaera mucosa]|uniref:Uncharacterized protein n=1 Tax=Paludisphaera mucosa TaxID=3030827 RepID=A0ABT6FCP8_9BACT|nr:hypothetical protein [Paludisphaera mucosa]MDG3005337.1 hypothetical protein [Paludisphaera mucosa]